MLLDAALTLADLGYPVFPCVPGAKRPLTPNGLLDATTDADTIERWWCAHPEANLAIPTAGLLVVDVDTIEGSANPWLSDQPEKLHDLAAGALSITPRGGRHYIFRQPAGATFRNTAGKLAPSVDTRADGGYILVPPSSVDGKPYRWGGITLDGPASDLAEPPDWLVEMLNPRGAAPSERSNLTAPSNAIPDGQRNSTLTSLAGSMRRVGMSEAEIYAALWQVNLDRCRPPLDPDEVRVIAWSNARYEPDQIAVAVVENHAASDLWLPSEDLGPRDPGPFPEALLRVPGFIDQVVDYNLAGAFKRQPVLALAGALALLSVLTGRKVRDPVGTRTNLYILGVGASGCGKERARKVNKDILSDADLAGKLLGNDDWASSSGLLRVVATKNAVLFQVDEIGRILRAISSDKSNSHLQGIVTNLMRLFTSSDSVFNCPAKADEKSEQIINQPHCCLYGTTVPESLYAGLTKENLTDGFLSRMLVFASNDHDPEPVDPRDMIVAPPPKQLVEVAKFWGGFSPNGNLTSENPAPIVVPYSEEALGVIAELEQVARRERKGAEDVIATMWTRTTEKARKLALLWACSANHREPVIGRAAAEWAAALSDYLTRSLLATARERIAETPFEANRNRLMRIIRDAGNDGISQAALTRATRFLKNRDRADLIESLKLGGEVHEETRSTGGRPGVVFVATGGF